MMADLKFLLFLFILISTCLAHTMPGRKLKEDAHYKDGKHNDAYDHETFLGQADKKEFGELDDKERVARLSKLVDKIDKNGDNNVSSSELTDWMRYISLKEPTEASKQHWKNNYGLVVDDDGLVSWEEYLKLNFPGSNRDEEIQARIKQNRKRFEAADENKDDKLSFNEFLAFQHLDLFPRMHDIFAEEIIQTMDVNKDGVISLEEFQKGTKTSRKDLKKEFENRDLDKSETLDKNEFKEWYFPTTYDPHENEAGHLLRKADTNKDNTLSRKEILDNYNIFVGSRATHWGKTLNRPVDEL